MNAQAGQDIVREFADRPRRYLNAGGLLELYWGLWILLSSLLAGASRLAPGAWHEAFVVGTVASPLLLGIGMKAVRRRVIDRRTGFVEYTHRWPSKPWHYLLAGAAIAVWFLLYWYRHPFLSTHAVASHLDRKWAILVAMFFLGLLWTIGSAMKFWRYLRGSRAPKEAGA